MAAGGLDNLSPLAVLSRGYSITFGKKGKPVSKTKELKVGELVTIKLSDGEAGATIDTIHKDEKTGK